MIRLSDIGKLPLFSNKPEDITKRKQILAELRQKFNPHQKKKLKK